MTALLGKKILLSGGSGFLGKHVIDLLISKGVDSKDIIVPRSKDYDLRVWENCKKATKDVDIVIHLAAKVGGIGFNQTHPGEAFYDNILIGSQLMEASRLSGVGKFVALGSVCAYPKLINPPFRESDLWNGYPEETNASYGLAKKMLIVQAQAYRKQYDFNAICLLPTNMYGPGDNFDPNSSHVIPALIKKVYDSKARGEKTLSVWGSGTATRDFLYVEDAAEAVVSAAESYNGEDPVNIGSGSEISITDLVKLMCKLMDFDGDIRFERDKPDGQPRRCVDVTKAKQEFGFLAKTPIEEGLKNTIEWYENSLNAIKH